MLINENIKYSYGGKFSSDEKWIHPTRSEMTYEIIYVIDGKVFLKENENEYHLKKGNLILLDANREHSGSEVSEKVQFYWLHFFAERIPFSQRLFENFDGAYLIRELLHYSHIKNCPEYMTNSILVRILAELKFQAEYNNGISNRTAGEIYEYIRSRKSAKLKVKDISETFGFSCDHITRLLKKHYGLSAVEIKDGFILKEAKRLLLDTVKYIKEISLELGFSNDKAFISFFKYHENISPGEYREKYAELHMNSK